MIRDASSSFWWSMIASATMQLMLAVLWLFMPLAKAADDKKLAKHTSAKNWSIMKTKFLIIEIKNYNVVTNQKYFSECSDRPFDRCNICSMVRYLFQVHCFYCFVFYIYNMSPFRDISEQIRYME